MTTPDLYTRRDAISAIAATCCCWMPWGMNTACGQETDLNSLPSVRLEVLTANVRFGTAKDGDDRWELRRELLANTWRSIDADVVGTQEMLPFQAAYLLEQLPEYAYIGQSRDPENADGEQCGIFYRRDRLVVLDAGYFWLSESPDVPGSKSWDTSLPRMATWARFYDRRLRAPVLVVNTHFDHIGSAARRHAAELVRRFVAERAGHQPVVVLGDFNCGEGSAPYDALLPDRAADAPLLRDAYRVTHPERKPNEGTFNGFLGKADGERIDWILVTQDCLVEECDIISTHEENRYPSDHFFVRANISFGSAR